MKELIHVWRRRATRQRARGFFAAAQTNEVCAAELERVVMPQATPVSRGAREQGRTQTRKAKSRR